MRRVLIDVGIAATLFAIGAAIAAPFEAHSPIWQRLLRPIVFLGITAVLSWRAGRRWAMTWALGIMLAGLSFHGWWTHSHGIEFFRPIPREKYYQLRGWKTEPQHKPVQ
jgi:hypothetical protein